MRTGFVGLGAMGAPMARNLHKAGLLAAVWNRDSSKSSTLATELGVRKAISLVELAANVSAVVVCFAADGDLLGVIRAMAPQLRSGMLVIDCSTTSANAAREAAAVVAAQGAAFLDCPVSGGTEGARLGTLAMMCGGDAAAFAAAQPILQAMSKTITHFGASGTGQAAKATNQIMCAGIIRAVAEAMAFARAQGLPLAPLVDTLGKGAGSSWYFVNRAPNMIKGEYPAGFRVRLHRKDLGICRDMAAANGVALPVVEDMLAEYDKLIDLGYGDEDISAVFRLKQTMFEQAAAVSRR